MPADARVRAGVDLPADRHVQRCSCPLMAVRGLMYLLIVRSGRARWWLCGGGRGCLWQRAAVLCL